MFFTPRGRPIFDAPEPPRLGEDPAPDLVRANRERGIRPDGRALAARHPDDRHVPYRVEAAAWEALDPWDAPDDAAAA